LAYFRYRQVNKVFPVGRAVNQTHVTAFISFGTFRKIAAPNIAQQVMNLVDC
jgi:hypothetical protein